MLGVRWMRDYGGGGKTRTWCVLWETNSLIGRWEMGSLRRGSCKTVMGRIHIQLTADTDNWNVTETVAYMHMYKGPLPRARFQILDHHSRYYHYHSRKGHLTRLCWSSSPDH
ncbi:hypothetical protein FIBSPDRAFT_591434 [Athelia psychrophila]|uniref:Uncharacterized protein n=1 Tax=Athelia psychrophila TaxID=1759441 RepID=A0A166H2P3_9AGAM|nr:hypothetical protein FIBSPDRAFT_591434 [Fibularhizoctonia sp. CBS 109695]